MGFPGATKAVSDDFLKKELVLLTGPQAQRILEGDIVAAAADGRADRQNTQCASTPAAALARLRIPEWRLPVTQRKALAQRIASVRLQTARACALQVHRYERKAGPAFSKLLDETLFYNAATGQKLSTALTLAKTKLFDNDQAVSGLLPILVKLGDKAEAEEGEGAAESPGEGEGGESIETLHTIGEKNLFRLLQIGRFYLAAAWCILCREEYKKYPSLLKLKDESLWSSDIRNALERRLAGKGGAELIHLLSLDEEQII